MKLINFERQVNQDLYYAILEKGFGSKTDIEHMDFENEVFKISPYDWNEPENPKPNFIHKPSGFKLWWYKYPLRSPEVNFNITHEEFSCILYDCVNSVSKFCKWEIDKFWESKGSDK